MAPSSNIPWGKPFIAHGYSLVLFHLYQNLQFKKNNMVHQSWVLQSACTEFYVLGHTNSVHLFKTMQDSVGCIKCDISSQCIHLFTMY